MPYSVFMLRRGAVHAVKIAAENDQVLFLTAWFGRPEDAVAEARAWMKRNLANDPRVSPQTDQ